MWQEHQKGCVSRIPIWECRAEGEARDGGGVCKVAVKGAVAPVKI